MKCRSNGSLRDLSCSLHSRGIAFDHKTAPTANEVRQERILRGWMFAILPPMHNGFVFGVVPVGLAFRHGHTLAVTEADTESTRLIPLIE